MEDGIMSIPSRVPLEGKAALMLVTLHSSERESARVVEARAAMAALTAMEEWRMTMKLVD